MIRDFQDKEIRIYTDAGRICRPLLIVENQKLLLKKSHIQQLKEREYNNYRSATLAGQALCCLLSLSLSFSLSFRLHHRPEMTHRGWRDLKANY